MQKFSYLLLTTFLLSSCASAPLRPTNIHKNDYGSTQEYIKKLIYYAMNKNSVTGLSIALVDDQRIIWSEGFGYADQENNIPASAETLYRVGSISKLFTDTAAMQLAEQGRLDIDHPLKEYLPEFSIKTNFRHSTDITPRMLMTHHSGLPRDKLNGFITPHPAPFTDLAGKLSEDYMSYPPNQLFSYSNLGITLLGHVVQNQSGIPFADYMKQAILTPLGMKNSSFEQGLSSSSLMARGYKGRQAAVELPLRDIPAGGLNASVNDISRFISMVLAGGNVGSQQLLKPETLKEMLRPQNSNVALDFNFHTGLGWLLSTLGGTKIENAGIVAHHSGGTLYFRSQMYVLPEKKLGVVVLSNSSTAGAVVDHIAKETLITALAAKTGNLPTSKREILPASKTILDAETQQRYIGNYTTIAGFARVYRKNNDLRVDLGGREFLLEPGDDGLFRLSYSLFGLYRINLGILGEIGLRRQNVAGRALLVATDGSQQLLIGERIEPAQNLHLWKKYLGDYEISQHGEDHRFYKQLSLIEDHGFLLVELTPVDQPQAKSRHALQPASDSVAHLLGNISEGGDTIRVVKIAGEERLIYADYLLKKR
jgi:CubicO group peptidase (beta-lactamase class C family)